MQLDLTDLASVKRFATDFQAAERGPHLLILNAGVMACPQTYTQEGFEMQIGARHPALCMPYYPTCTDKACMHTAAGTNHFGHFVLTRELLPCMRSLVRLPAVLPCACITAAPS
jgi:NAD(P)-dependent dehydrogenase (short-subunit alcohol dehydrogenase family)